MQLVVVQKSNGGILCLVAGRQDRSNQNSDSISQFWPYFIDRLVVNCINKIRDCQFKSLLSFVANNLVCVCNTIKDIADQCYMTLEAAGKWGQAINGLATYSTL